MIERRPFANAHSADCILGLYGPAGAELAWRRPNFPMEPPQPFDRLTIYDKLRGMFSIQLRQSSSRSPSTRENSLVLFVTRV